VQRYLKLLETVEKPEEIVATPSLRRPRGDAQARIENLSPELATAASHPDIDALCGIAHPADAGAREIGGTAGGDRGPAGAGNEEAAARTLADLRRRGEAARAPGQQCRPDAPAFWPGCWSGATSGCARPEMRRLREELEATLTAERSASSAARRRCCRGSPDLAGNCSLRKEPGARKNQAGAGHFPKMNRCGWHLWACSPCRRASVFGDAVGGAGGDPCAAQACEWRSACALRRARRGGFHPDRARGAAGTRHTRQPTDLLLSMDVRVRHLLVDEFRTRPSPVGSCSNGLTAGWEAGTGAPVFVVGDPMQSSIVLEMHRWGLFLHARRAGCRASDSSL